MAKLRTIAIAVAAALAIAAMPAAAQSCYTQNYNQAEALFNQKKYADAKKRYRAANACPDKPSQNTIAARIAACDQRISEQQRTARREQTATQRRQQPTQSQSASLIDRLFPVCGVTIGKTTIDQARRLTDFNKVDEDNRKSGWISVFFNNGPSFFDNSVGGVFDGVIDEILVNSPDNMPQKWIDAGLRWSMSYNQWLSKLKGLGFSVTIDEEPMMKYSDGRTYLYAVVTASHKSGLKARLKFDSGNANGEGYSADARNSIASIFMSVDPPAASATTTTATATASGRDVSVSTFFPVCGVTIGKTTVGEANRMSNFRSIDNENSGWTTVYLYDDNGNSIPFYDNKKDGYIDEVMISSNEKLPQRWKNAGIDWSMSYNQWLSLLRGWGADIETIKAPTTATHSGRTVLVANVKATLPDGLAITIDFNFGNENGEGYSTNARNSLNNIFMTVDDARQTTATATATATASGGGVSMSSFFPVSGITIGKTTLDQAKLSADFSDIDESSIMSGWITVSLTTGAACYDNSINDVFDDVIDEFLVTASNGYMPQKWANLGMSWSLSYNQWLSLLRSLGFSVTILESPSTEADSGRTVFKARVQGTHSCGLSIKLRFDKGNKNGEGYSADARNSLHSIFMNVNP